MHSDFLLAIVVLAALAFDFTNGFHDTANVVAASISTRALPPRTAIAIASILNFAGAFISLQVAATIATGIVNAGAVTETIAFAGQVVSGSLLALAHGTNDAQKTMGVISLALVAHGNLSTNNFHVPRWVVIASASAIALGTYAGGWRIIRTVGMRIIKMDTAQGFAAQGGGAAVILAVSHFGFPISTTHVINGGVMGAGAARRVSAVRWGVAGNIATAWLLTLPAAAASGAAVYGVTRIFGHGVTGPLVVLIGGCVAVMAIVLWVSRRDITAAVAR